MDWVKLKYSRTKINSAGDVLIAEESTSEELGEATDILSNWRSAHSFPLHVFAVRLTRLTKLIEADALVVRRLKRIPSILNKLKRAQTSKMRMSRMQDVGGCRAVFSSLDNVYALVEKYRKSRGIKHKLQKEDDYIKHPKNDGYRSVHLIYKYYSDKSKEFDGLSIEIQIRTKLQHYWATAVETVDHFTRQAIKSNEGEKDWMDFFKLVSTAFAQMEGTEPVPGTPTDKTVLLKKIQSLAKKLKVVKKMNEWTRVHKIIDDFEKGSKKKYDYYLLNLNLETKELKIIAYKKNEVDLANEAYSKFEERMLRNNEDRDIVLVSAETTKELRRAYPNYFLDAKEFTKSLDKYFEKNS